MHLTRYSDYSLRVLIFLALRPGVLVTIPEIAGSFGISRAHLMKVVHALSKLGYVETVRGRGGGLTLGLPANEIRLGQLLRQMEGRVELAECFSTADGREGCRIAPACKLRAVFSEALAAFFGSLDEYTLEDVVAGQSARLRRLLVLSP